jgi:predicted ATPase/class 3 adenylate cyclase
VNSRNQTDTVTFLFTEIEGGTRLWEHNPERMQPALARHDALARAAVEDNCGTVVKMTGGGVYAAFDDPIDAVGATIQLQQALADPIATHGVALRVRCGLHAGIVERRDNDFFGSVINRAARVMSAAHGSQVLLSQSVAALVGERLPAGVTLRDLGSVRLRGFATAERVYQVVHPKLREEFPALSSLETAPNNLPQQTTTFVGRERELAEVRQLLGNARLLTLLGAVGVGKTRLSLQVAADVLDNYPDGVWLVELEAVTDPGLVDEAVARALSVSEETSVPLKKTLAAHVAPRTMLLILDQCEHLIEACARAADALLRAAAALRIVATSREPLRADGEQTYALPTLALPQAHARPDAQGAGKSAAVHLFVERARLQQPDFALTDRNAPVVAAICARLDGIPLALEIAAAWMGALSLEEIDARLANHLALVEVDSRTAPTQQRSLRTMLDRSYELLDDNERLLFDRISVFEGGFDLEAAEQICGAPPVSDDDVLDLLTTLADKSLLVVESDGQRSRFRQFEILRAYPRKRAGETPAGSEDMASTRARQAEHFLELAKAAHSKLAGSEQAQWSERLDVEYDNLRAAFTWALTENMAPDCALELGAALYPFWRLRGYLTEGRKLLREALAMPGEQPGDARAGALYAAGVLALLQSDIADAKRMFTMCIALRRELGPPRELAAALSGLAEVLQQEGDAVTANDYREQALAIRGAHGDPVARSG